MKILYPLSSERSTLPPFILEMLAAMPKAGEGIHHWLFRLARQLHAHLPAVEIIALLENRVQGCGRHVSRKEITDAVQNALACAWMPGSNAAPVPAASKWPKLNQEQRTAILPGTQWSSDRSESFEISQRAGRRPSPIECLAVLVSTIRHKFFCFMVKVSKFPSKHPVQKQQQHVVYIFRRSGLSSIEYSPRYYL